MNRSVDRQPRDRKGRFGETSKLAVSAPTVDVGTDRTAPSEPPTPVAAGPVPSLNRCADTPRKKLGGPDHHKRLFDDSPMGSRWLARRNKELTRRDARTLAEGGTLYSNGPQGSASIVERAYPADMDPYDQDRLDTILAAHALEWTDKHFKASDIAKYVRKRRQVLFGRDLARPPLDSAVAAAALEQTRREDRIAEWGNSTLGMDRPWADNDPFDIFNYDPRRQHQRTVD